MTRVIIADDHPLVRKGLAQLIAETDDMRVLAEAEGYASVMSALRKHDADVLLLDVDLPGKNGLEILKAVRSQHPKVQVVMLSMYPEDQYGLRALKGGAAGYLTKCAAPQTVLEAIRSAARGVKYVTPALAQALAEHVAAGSGDARPRHETLSDREFQTLRLIASGKKLADIAEALALSPKTVSVYRARLMEKMDLRSNAELTRYAVEQDLLD
jgi:DNA-binding NarL/FixJ family response regulator